MYCAVAQVRDRLTPGGNASGTAAATSSGLRDEQISQAIAKGDATLDTYLLGRYAIPVTGEWDGDGGEVVTGLAIEPVQQWSVSLAAYFATLSWRRNLDLAADDPIRLEYAHVMGILNQVASGKITLQLPPPGGVPGDAVGGDAVVVNMYTGVLFDSERNLVQDVPRWADPYRTWP